MIDSVVYLGILAQEAMPYSAIFVVNDTNFETQYIGYGQKGISDITDAKFSILRIQKTIATNTTTFMWANGIKERIFAFSEAQDLHYEFLK